MDKDRQELKMRNICVMFVPRVLREDQKESRCQDSREMVDLINSDPEVLDTLVTCVESWIYCYDPKTKRQRSKWKPDGSPRPKTARQSKSTHKHLMIPFFLIELTWSTCIGFPLDRQSTKKYYVEVLREFRTRFRRKMPALFKSAQRYFHQDNASVHNPILVTDYLTKMGINTVPQPPYSPYLASCDYWLFPKHRHCRYETIEEMKEALMKVIDTLTQEEFHGALQKFLERYN